VVIAFHDQLVVERDAGFLEGAGIAGQAFAGIDVVGRTRDEGDAPVAQFDQMARPDRRRIRCRA
jgi:hypothetical protein